MRNEIQIEKILRYLETVVSIPSPTGYTTKATEWLVAHAEENKIRFTRTNKGAVIYHFGPKDGVGKMMAAHLDTLGGMVKEVKDSRVRIVPIGGFPALNIVGEEVTIHAADGVVTGTFLPENPAVHVNSDLKKLVPDWDNSSIRVDSVDFGKVSKLVETGDFVSFNPGFKVTNNFVKSRFLDDKASVAVMLHLADILMESKTELAKPFHLFFNVTEETGQGVAGFPLIDELLIIDMGVVGDGCQGRENAVSICAKDSSGPYNYELTQSLISLAKKNEIPYRTDIFPFYGSDGSALLRAGNDVKVALIGQGVDASHGYERTHTDALIGTARLALLFLG